MLFCRRRAVTTTAGLFVLPGALASCNPLSSTSCGADPALGTSIDIDFTKGSVNSFLTSGNPTYSSEDGVTFTVAAEGDAPQLASIFYIMFGRITVTMKTASGTGICSSVVLMSDDGDEIDYEWLGHQPNQVQTNYFGKGLTTSWGRGQINPAPGNQENFMTYTIDWNDERIVWMVGDSVIRVQTAADAEYSGAGVSEYPQTPMMIKLGIWAPGTEQSAEGTISWAGGLADFANGPFSMSIKELQVTDYSTGRSYSYGDRSGNWTSIESNGGKVNGNAGAANGNASAAAGSDNSPTDDAATATASTVDVPQGIAYATTTYTNNNLPPGWTMQPNGKVFYSGVAASKPPNMLLLCSPLLIVLTTLFASFAVFARPRP